MNGCEDCPLLRRYEDKNGNTIGMSCGGLDMTDIEKESVIAIPNNCRFLSQRGIKKESEEEE